MQAKSFDQAVRCQQVEGAVAHIRNEFQCACDILMATTLEFWKGCRPACYCLGNCSVISMKPFQMHGKAHRLLATHLTIIYPVKLSSDFPFTARLSCTAACNTAGENLCKDTQSLG